MQSEQHAQPNYFWQHSPDHSQLVEIFLWEENYEEAWQEASAGGCSEYLWLQLADAIAKITRTERFATRNLSRPLQRTDFSDPSDESLSYWREHYNLGYIMKRDWSKLRPKLEGKIHIYVGEADNFFLNNAVYLVDDFLKTTRDPYYGGEIDYEPRFEHCWCGDHTRPNAISRLCYHQLNAPKIVERIMKSAPAGADLKSWRH